MKKYGYVFEFGHPYTIQLVNAENLRKAKQLVSKKHDDEDDDLRIWEIKPFPANKQFYKKIKEDHLESAKFFFNNFNQNQDIHLTFQGFKEVFPYELFFINHYNPTNKRRATSRKSFGWGKKLPPEKLEQEFDNKTYRYFGEILKAKKIYPPIEIDGQICDGMGRIMMCHALGIKVKVAIYKTNNI